MKEIDALGWKLNGDGPRRPQSIPPVMLRESTYLFRITVTRLAMKSSPFSEYTGLGHDSGISTNSKGNGVGS